MPAELRRISCNLLGPSVAPSRSRAYQGNTAAIGRKTESCSNVRPLLQPQSLQFVSRVPQHRHHHLQSSLHLIHEARDFTSFQLIIQCHIIQGGRSGGIRRQLSLSGHTCLRPKHLHTRISLGGSWLAADFASCSTTACRTREIELATSPRPRRFAARRAYAKFAANFRTPLAMTRGVSEIISGNLGPFGLSRSQVWGLGFGV